MTDQKRIIAAIPTKYWGVEFRSRLEARWAVYFEAMGISWEYEFQGYALLSGWYLPDFWLPGVNTWAEVKPNKPTPLEVQKIKELVEGTGHPCLLLCGSPRVYPVLCIAMIEYANEDKYKKYRQEFKASEELKIPGTWDYTQYYEKELGYGVDRLIREYAKSGTLYECRDFSDYSIDVDNPWPRPNPKFVQELEHMFPCVVAAVSKALSAKFN